MIRSSSKLILLTKAKAARDKNAGLLQKTAAKQRDHEGRNTDKAEYLLVDGYNIIFAWDE